VSSHARSIKFAVVVALSGGLLHCVASGSQVGSTSGASGGGDDSDDATAPFVQAGDDAGAVPASEGDADNGEAAVPASGSNQEAGAAPVSAAPKQDCGDLDFGPMTVCVFSHCCALAKSCADSPCKDFMACASSCGNDINCLMGQCGGTSSPGYQGGYQLTTCMMQCQ
jgi:hypothetical protein